MEAVSRFEVLRKFLEMFWFILESFVDFEGFFLYLMGFSNVYEILIFFRIRDIKEF